MTSVVVDKWETEDLSKAQPYTVRMRITQATGVSPNLFVFDLDEKYQDVASAKDLERYPPQRGAAWPTPGYYRDTEVSVSFQRKVDLRNFVTGVMQTIRQTCSDWMGESVVTLEDPTFTLIEVP